MPWADVLAALDGSVCALDRCAVQENQGAELQALYPCFSGLCGEAQPCSCEPGAAGLWDMSPCIGPRASWSLTLSQY